MGCDDDGGYGERERTNRERLEIELRDKLNKLGYPNPYFLEAVRLICHDHEYGTRR